MDALRTQTEFTGAAAALLPDLKARDHRSLERDGYVLMGAATAFGAVADHGLTAASVQAARLFVIFCAVALPVLGLWTFAF
jgi:hypothetical protein